LKNPVFIQGLPGLGFVGKISVDFLVEQLKPTKFAELYSTYLALPDGGLGVEIELNGTFNLPKYEFYAYAGSPNMIFLTGDVQPSVQGQYDVAERVLTYIERFGCKSIIALGGYGIEGGNIDKVYAVASDPNLIQMMGKGKVRIAQGGSIRGAFGVILGLGMARNVECLGLLGATSGRYPDVRASRNVVQILADMYHLQINFGDMDQKVREMEERLKRLRKAGQAVPKREDRQKEKKSPSGYIS
jgi:proteasome assembly chaperone (PAC2) family protein